MSAAIGSPQLGQPDGADGAQRDDARTLVAITLHHATAALIVRAWTIPTPDDPPPPPRSTASLGRGGLGSAYWDASARDDQCSTSTHSLMQGAAE